MERRSFGWPAERANEEREGHLCGHRLERHRFKSSLKSQTPWAILWPMIYPMYAMFLLTLLVGAVTLRRRFGAVYSKKVSVKYFRAMQSPDPVPDDLVIPSRNFTNLFELPVLFYVVCLLAMNMQMTGPLMVGLAWGFVLCRCVHSLVHLTYNNVVHRMVVFITGFFILAAMWTLLVIGYA